MDIEDLRELAWKYTPSDYKGMFNARRHIMALRDGATTYVPLNELTEAELMKRIPEAALGTESDFEHAFALYIEALQTAHNRYFAHAHPTLTPPRIGYERGTRYNRVFTENLQTGSRSALAFVDRGDGSIYKSAGWKSPAKGKRGDILDLDRLLSRPPNAMVSF